mmetsp:Transcript_84343/g.247378  ORF Transcript_84343/g.247378 Transcript_84343/m.247378 type:complete len:259 (-) Transcript_84343:131-907(-)
MASLAKPFAQPQAIASQKPHVRLFTSKINQLDSVMACAFSACSCPTMVLKYPGAYRSSSSKWAMNSPLARLMPMLRLRPMLQSCSGLTLILTYVTRGSCFASWLKNSECCPKYVSTTTSSLSSHVCAWKHIQRDLWNFCLDSVVGVTTETRPRLPPVPSGPPVPIFTSDDGTGRCSPTMRLGWHWPSVKSQSEHSRSSQSSASRGRPTWSVLRYFLHSWSSRAARIAESSTRTCLLKWQPQRRQDTSVVEFGPNRRGT